MVASAHGFRNNAREQVAPAQEWTALLEHLRPQDHSLRHQAFQHILSCWTGPTMLAILRVDLQQQQMGLHDLGQLQNSHEFSSMTEHHQHAPLQNLLQVKIGDFGLSKLADNS